MSTLSQQTQYLIRVLLQADPISIMSNSTSIFRATMHPSGREFDILPGQSLLESGLSAGVALPFACANGSCGDCLARLEQGQVNKIRHHDYSLTEAQKLAGYCLLCSSTATTDVQIEVHEATSIHDIPQQHLQAKLCRVERVQDVNIVMFKFIRAKALRFLPGQRANLIFPDGDTAELPISSCPCYAQYVEFHLPVEPLRHHVHHWVAAKFLRAATSRDRITISGPAGHFTLSSALRKPKLYIAEGLEFAQLQGLIEQVLNFDMGTRCCLLWKAADNDSHYRLNWCRSWSDAIDEFDFVPAAKNSDVLNTLPNEWEVHLESCEVYLGTKNPVLVQQLVRRNVDPASIFYPEQQLA
ncbi:MAG: 2Fe-2S iron-sulfur cluster-binding protein [Granulosicoccaceae bacterium]